MTRSPSEARGYPAVQGSLRVQSITKTTDGRRSALRPISLPGLGPRRLRVDWEVARFERLREDEPALRSVQQQVRRHRQLDGPARRSLGADRVATDEVGAGTVRSCRSRD